VGIVSQNVDGLHQAAGSRSVVELHGSLARVSCLACEKTISRAHLQTRLERDNPTWLQLVAVAAPDGDVDLPEHLVEAFVDPCCACGGDLMPNVVFFGGNVKPEVLQSAWDLFNQAEGLVVVGSSLTVFSGFRFVKKAAEQGMPIAIVNHGPTRADELASLLIDADAGETLQAVTRGLIA
jgi:NAD+-dependent protein deacetylase sirtuin 4